MTIEELERKLKTIVDHGKKARVYPSMYLQGMLDAFEDVLLMITIEKNKGTKND